MQKVAEKILAVMKDVGWVKKDGHNKAQNYDYVSEAGLVAEVRESMMKHGLIMVTNVTSCDPKESGTTAGGAIKWLTTITAECRFIDCESGESITTAMAGSGMDPGDKGVFKAITGLTKYALMKTLLIPTGDDPEADEGTDRDNAPRQTQSTQRDAQEAPADSREDGRPIPEDFGRMESKYDGPTSCHWCGNKHVVRGDIIVGSKEAGWGHINCYKSGLYRG